MAVLETIRVKLGVLITVLIAVALLSFLVDPNSLATAFQGEQMEMSVGTINGKKISYQEYQARVELETTMRAQMLQGANETQRHQYIHSCAWNYFLTKYLFIPKAEELGITVTEGEISDMLNTIPLEQLNFYIENMDENPMVKANWEFMREDMVNNMYQAKLSSVYSQSAAYDSLKVDFAANLAATFSTADYVKVPYDMNQAVEVSEDEIQAYYNAHKNVFEQDAYRNIVYVAIKAENAEGDNEMKASEQARQTLKQIIADSENTLEGFKAAAIAAGQVVDETSLYAGQFVINYVEGIIDSSKKLARWAFENEIGAVTKEVYAIDNNTYVVAALAQIHDKGTATLAEAQPQIEAAIKAQKVKETALAEVNAKIEGAASIADAAKALDTQVLLAENVSFDNIQTELDNALIGAIAGAEIGKVTKAVAGNDGVYVVCVKDREVKNVESQKFAVNMKASRQAQLAWMNYCNTVILNNTESNVEKYF